MGPSRPKGGSADHSPVVFVQLSEARFAANRLGSTLNLGRAEREDAQQDLIVDLLYRFPSFNPSRGSAGAFAGKIVRNRASILGGRIRTQRARADQYHDGDMSGGAQVDESVGDLDRQLDLKRFLLGLPPRLQSLCVQLAVGDTPNTGRSRASIYRDLNQVRSRYAEFIASSSSGTSLASARGSGR